jgi:hypothetical protein
VDEAVEADKVADPAQVEEVAVDVNETMTMLTMTRTMSWKRKRRK